MREARFYEKLEDGRVRCTLCPHECLLRDGQVGVCGVRQNREGTLYSLVYGKPIAVHIDPIEKKPLFHVFPGSRSFSLATVGCNFRCLFCQNSDISQVRLTEGSAPGEDLPPEELVRLAERHGCRTISYTYTEPTVFYEYAFDTAVLAAERGLLNVFVTNGFISPEPLRAISPVLHAANVDLKGWDEGFYRRVVGGDLEAVRNSLRLMKKLGIWVEVTTLCVPGYVDTDEQFRSIARFIRDELGPETPWHVSRFYPHYRMVDRPPTDIRVLRRARQIGLEEGLRYVYSGNVPGDEGENTFCYHCRALLIRRWGFSILENRLKDGKCPDCGSRIDGIGL
ncbi:MAG: AmmeMemoRadiSam system radical SAM enzyme [candidate division KSB1 bacterium]|nr:AmmeMemoRadiSam system radical SAM enzyme [candidate division KSB1 bacterium]